MNRRDLLKLATVTAAGGSAAAAATVAGATAASSATAKWPGHKPGKIILGLACENNISKNEALVGGKFGANRTFYKWDGISGEIRNIQADHAAGRMPWTSFRPPSGTYSTWDDVASGRHDAAIRARARAYATLRKPVIVTFSHEPHTETAGDPAQFAKAWCRIHDVMKAETGLKNVVSVPIIGEWTFNPYNRNGNPGAYITTSVLNRCHFLGVDLYQMKRGETYKERLGRVLSWLDARGHSDMMIGLGETGCTDDFTNIKGGAWWTASWNWAAANTNRIGVINYFNSALHNNNGLNWLLTESTSKLNAFKASMGSATNVRAPLAAYVAPAGGTTQSGTTGGAGTTAGGTTGTAGRTADSGAARTVTTSRTVGAL